MMYKFHKMHCLPIDYKTVTIFEMHLSLISTAVNYLYFTYFASDYNGFAA